MRELVLHIGLPKTGTSYLQLSMVRNADRLLEAGVGVSPYQDPGNGGSRHFRKAVLTDGLDAVVDRLAQAPGERILVSSEQLSDWLAHPEFAEALRRSASRHFTPRIVIFLRRQDFLKESLFAQVAKNWYEGDILHETHYDYDHDRRLALLESVFGRGHVQVLLYREPGPNDVLGDFLQALGLRLRPADLREIPAQNVSMHRRKVLFLSQVPKPDPDIQDLAKLMTRVVGRSRAIADDGVRFVMSPARRLELVARHQPGNRAILARYDLPDPRGFGELPDPDEPWTPPRPITPAELAAISAQTLGFCARELGLRYGLRMGTRATGALSVMAWRRFVAPAAPRPVLEPTAARNPPEVRPGTSEAQGQPG